MVAEADKKVPLIIDFVNPHNRLYKMFNDRITSIEIEPGYLHQHMN